MEDKKAYSYYYYYSSSSSLYELHSHQSRLAMLFLKVGDYKKALEITRTIVAYSPNSAAALGILGTVHFGTTISPRIAILPPP